MTVEIPVLGAFPKILLRRRCQLANDLGLVPSTSLVDESTSPGDCGCSMYFGVLPRHSFWNSAACLWAQRAGVLLAVDLEK